MKLLIAICFMNIWIQACGGGVDSLSKGRMPNVDELKDDAEIEQLIESEGDHNRPDLDMDFLNDDKVLSECYKNMRMAVPDGSDHKLTRIFYDTFIGIQSKGKIPAGGFDRMGHSLVTIFYAETCSSCYEETSNRGCCTSATAYIDISANNPDQLKKTLSLVCHAVNQVIESYLSESI